MRGASLGRLLLPDRFLRAVFLDSDTDVAVLSALAEVPRNNPLTIEEAVRTREQMNLAGPGRLYLHGIVLPNAGVLTEQIDGMQALSERDRIAAWKLYPVWGPGGSGYWLDGPLGTAVLDQARKLGVKTVAVHKGITLPGMDSLYSQCRDIGPAARRYPDLTFLVYHAGVEFDVGEGPYEVGRALGLDSLIRSLQENGIPPRSNVYADLGAVWKILMRDPDQAAHLLGKLLVHLGEDRVLWGTDSIRFGSPQDQIEAFRAFEITPEFQQRHGYPALTRSAKAKILGLNAAQVYGVDPAACGRSSRRTTWRAPGPSGETAERIGFRRSVHAPVGRCSRSGGVAAGSRSRRDAASGVLPLPERNFCASTSARGVGTVLARAVQRLAKAVPCTSCRSARELWNPSARRCPMGRSSR